MIEQLKNINFSSICDLLAYDVNNPLLFNTGLFLFLFLGFLLIYQLTKEKLENELAELKEKVALLEAEAERQAAEKKAAAAARSNYNRYTNR